MEKIATLTFQANDNSDVFLKADLFEDDVHETDEALIGIEDTHFNKTKPWVNGKRPEMLSVNVDGDSGVINVWIMKVSPGLETRIVIYIEYEETDDAEFEEKEEEQ
jgi:hypothetical protein